jgi:hypothetical protein
LFFVGGSVFRVNGNSFFGTPENNNLIICPRTGYFSDMKNMNGSFGRDMPGKKSSRPMDPHPQCGCGTFKKKRDLSCGSLFGM